MRKKILLITIFLATLLINITTATAQTGVLEIKDSNGTRNLTYQQLEEMPKTNEYAEIYCYGTLVSAGDWTGVKLSDLLNQINSGPNVNSIQFVASDAYNVAIPIEVAIAPETIIAYQKDGILLPEGLRLVLPGYNGANWIAQIVSMTLSDNVVATPSAASGSGARASAINNFIENSQKPSTTTNPQQQTTTPQPIPETSTPNPTAPPANVTQVEPTLKQQTAANQSVTFEGGTIAIIAALFALSFATAGIVMFKRRTNLKDSHLNKD